MYLYLHMHEDQLLMKYVFTVLQGQWTDGAIDELMAYLDCDSMYLQVCFCVCYIHR